MQFSQDTDGQEVTQTGAYKWYGTFHQITRRYKTDWTMYWQAVNAKPDVALVDVSALKGLGHVGLDVGAFHVKTYQQRMAPVHSQSGDDCIDTGDSDSSFFETEDDHQAHSTDSIMESVFGREDEY